MAIKQEYKNLNLLTSAIKGHKKPFIKSDYIWLNEELLKLTYTERTEATDWCRLADKITDLKIISLCLLSRNKNTSGDKKYTDNYSIENKNSLDKIIGLMDEIVDSSLTFSYQDEGECYDFESCLNDEDMTNVLIDNMMDSVNKIYFEFNDLGKSVILNRMAFTYDKLEKITYDSKDFKDFKELQNYIEESYWHQCGYVYGEFDSSIEIEFVMSDSRYGNITQKGFSVLIDFPYYEVLDTMSFLEFMIEDWGYFMESVQSYDIYQGWGDCDGYEEVEFDFSKCKFEYLPNKVLAKSMKDKEMIDLFVSTMNTHRGENTRNDFLSILKKYLYDFKKVKAHKIILDSLISGNLTFFPPSEEVSKALRETYDNLSVDEREEYREKISEVEKYSLECKMNEKIQSLLSINDLKDLDIQFCEFMNNTTSKERGEYGDKFKQIKSRIRELAREKLQNT
jgi:hypothetical protein